MIKQRRDSIEAYLRIGRQIGGWEAEEIDIIQRFLPDQMDDKKPAEAVEQVIAETGASGIKDMGNVMGMLRVNLPAKWTLTKQRVVKARLG